MKAKNTVMDLNRLTEEKQKHLPDMVSFHNIAEAQAEISFKAGIITGTVEGKYDGRREVVEWMKKNTVWSILFNTAEGKAQLKEWGING